MNRRQIRLGFIMSAVCVLITLMLPLPLSGVPVAALMARPLTFLLTGVIVLVFAFAAGFRGLPAIVIGLVGAGITAGMTLMLLRDPLIAGDAASGFWMVVIGVWLASWICVVALAGLKPRNSAFRKIIDLAIPLLFGAAVFYLWEVVVRGAGVPPVLLPSPSAAATKFMASLPILGADFVQTFIRGVLIGYAIGCGAGLLVAILAHRFEFLGRGLLPLGNFFSALPLVGVAPIMVMWFGFDWPSKAAVVALVTFFPMLVNALAGLQAAGDIERDLMRSYGASYAQTLIKLYLPAALPFIFNALKINATLALIGAIVAEFFGTPTQGIGFRISTEAGRMALDMVWAEIALAAIAGMAFYGLVALAERVTTFWHPSMRT
ncbi:NitT/TauT family transport system permease protein [Tardiphaga robiniae]|uniref:ABC transporter permease n=2 Tax=Tardiphaga TaxID=1395974 RepID=UPI0028562A79|nr:NitT/TauT family transport system permease protein [Tardiphaga robiniae]